MMSVRRQWWPLPLLAVLAAGCAGNPADQEPSPRDPHAETRREIALRPDVPDQWFMLPDVELVGFQYYEGDEAKRDTVRGAGQVAVWLRSLEVRTQYESDPFHLEVREVLVCDGAAVERGRYPVPGRVEGRDTRAIAWRRYMARWEPRGDAWKLSEIWLSPPISAHVADLATGCTAAPVLPEGLGFGIAAGAGMAADLSGVEAGMTADGFGDLTTVGDGVLELRAWGVQEFSPTFAGRLGYTYAGNTAIDGFRQDVVQEVTLEVGIQSHVLFAVGEARVGPLRIGVGPALAFNRITYDRLIAANDGELFTNRVHWVNVFGGVAQASLGLRVTPAATLLGRFEYAYFPELAPPHPDVPGPIRSRDMSFVLGFEYVP